MDPTQTSGTSDHEEQRGRKRMALTQAGASPEPMSDRDRIAEKAMQAYLLEYGIRDYATIAEWSYKMADAMLAERARSGSSREDTPSA
jgi:hypothetical protein